MQPPFVRQSGKRIRESISGEVDPAGYDKDQLEAQMMGAVEMFFGEQRMRIQAELEPRIPDDRKAIIQLPLPFWNNESKRLLSILLPFLARGAEGGVGVQQAVVQGMGIDIDWTLPFTEAANWARRHGAALVTRVTQTTKDRIRSVVGNWIETPDRTLPDLWKQLQEDHAFSRSRAKLIATTETTRAYAEGEIVGARTLEKEGWFGYVKEWQTAMDDRVCPICEPLQGVTVQTTKGEFAGGLQGPPAHPGCRCWINTIPVLPG